MRKININSNDIQVTEKYVELDGGDSQLYYIPSEGKILSPSCYSNLFNYAVDYSDNIDYENDENIIDPDTWNIECCYSSNTGLTQGINIELPIGSFKLGECRKKGSQYFPIRNAKAIHLKYCCNCKELVLMIYVETQAYFGTTKGDIGFIVIQSKNDYNDVIDKQIVIRTKHICKHIQQILLTIDNLNTNRVDENIEKICKMFYCNCYQYKYLEYINFNGYAEKENLDYYTNYDNQKNIKRFVDTRFIKGDIRNNVEEFRTVSEDLQLYFNKRYSVYEMFTSTLKTQKNIMIEFDENNVPIDSFKLTDILNKPKIVKDNDKIVCIGLYSYRKVPVQKFDEYSIKYYNILTSEYWDVKCIDYHKEVSLLDLNNLEVFEKELNKEVKEKENRIIKNILNEIREEQIKELEDKNILEWVTIHENSIITRQESYNAGNCQYGTEEFIETYFDKEITEITLKELSEVYNSDKITSMHKQYLFSVFKYLYNNRDKEEVTA